MEQQQQPEIRGLTLGSKIVECPQCGEKMKARGLKGHIRWKHEGTTTDVIAANELKRLRAEINDIKATLKASLGEGYVNASTKEIILRLINS